jgi:hypothetical protein
MPGLSPKVPPSIRRRGTKGRRLAAVPLQAIAGSRRGGGRRSGEEGPSDPLQARLAAGVSAG